MIKTPLQLPSWLARSGVALALCAGLQAPAAAQTLKAVMASKVTVLDPVLTASHQTRNHAYMIYDTLLATDADNQVQPQMAEKWELSPDGKTYTFTLRDGLKWHDGTPVTAEDCVASIARWAKQDVMGRQLMPLVEAMNVVDGKTFTVVMKTPADILTALAKPSGLPSFIMPKRVAETPASKPIADYTGSGPFKFVQAEFQPGVKAVYEKFADYVPRSEPPSGLAGGKVVKVDRVEMLVLPDAMTSVTALIGGEVDYVESVPFDMVPMVEGEKGVKVFMRDKMGMHPMYRFNHEQKPFNNKLIRQAAMYAIGQEEILKAQVGDARYYTVCAAVFGCGLPYASDLHADMVVPSNIAKAKELLKQAGYANEPVVVLHATDITTSAAMPVVVASQLRQAGFNVQLQAMDFMAMLSRRANRGDPASGGWSLFVTTWHMSEIMDPLRNYGVSASGKDAWFGWADVPEVERLRGEYLVAANDAQRKALATRIQDVMLDEGVTIPLGQIIPVSAVSDRLDGMVEAAAPVFWGVTKSGK